LTESSYKLSVRSGFSSAHYLRGYDGECERVHGHNWRVKLVVSRSGLDELGMGIDFTRLSVILDQVLADLDHRDLNTFEEFKEKNPTAENLAAFIYRKAKEHLPDGVTIEEVEIFETDKYSVSYSE